MMSRKNLFLTSMTAIIKTFWLQSYLIISINVEICKFVLLFYFIFGHLRCRFNLILKLTNENICPSHNEHQRICTVNLNTKNKLTILYKP